ncbi:hypothetical protein GCM10027586_19890 [Kineococcus gypseus]|uniref:hypothetical protein n=1 Tax=Kineococcus gypseus TaxID=1637102 RepID=UPI003D7EE94D
MLPPALVGDWSGTNAFRLMPGDPPHEAPATARVSTAAGGHLALVAYAWHHPDDGPQDGLLVVAGTGEGDAVSATWADSWHQQPATMALTGRRTADGVVLEGRYGGDWTWRTELRTSPGGGLLLRMDNVVPVVHATAEVPAGPYAAMLLRAHRA